jgi:outer membrane protein TolC
MLRYPTIFRLIIPALLIVALQGCAVTPKPLTEQEMKATASLDRAAMFAREAPPLTRPLTLPDAIARALLHNLERRSKVMDEALALGQTRLDRWELLPKLVGSLGYSGRDSPNASRSRDQVTQTTSTSNPTYSADRESRTYDLGLTWNILDFGVGWVNAQQNADRSLIAAERRRKTVNALVHDVRFAYWRAVAAQSLENEVSAAVAEAEKALEDARNVEKAGLRSPMDILRYQKSLLETLRQLEGLSQELSLARIELAALVNLPPDSDFRLDEPDPERLQPPLLNMTPEQMEELAFINNPDLREQVYLSRIAADETRKTLLKLLPGINLNFNHRWDSNSFLVDNHWNEAGAKLIWNLINIFSAPDQIEQAKASETAADARRVALRMAVLAQVHIAYRQFHNAQRQYLRARDLDSVERRLTAQVKARSISEAVGVLESIAGQTSAISARLRLSQSYAQMESAFGKMQATLGRDLLPETLENTDLDTVATLIAQRMSDWNSLPVGPPGGPRP